ncbi:MAG: hypothetical protein ACKVQV_16160 [Bacteroidia bacterium]
MLYESTDQGTGFIQQSLSNAKIYACDFMNCDLTKIKGLRIEQLKGVKLVDANLPDFVIDSIKINYKQYGIFIRENKHYKYLRDSLELLRKKRTPNNVQNDNNG